MRRYAVGILLPVLLAAGCAGIRIPTEGVFPCRMRFEGLLETKGQRMPVSGAASLSSASSGLAQIYGPLGLAAFTVHVQVGRVQIMDMWGRTLKTYSVPFKECIGLLAGIPPRGPYLYRRRVEGGFQVAYLWGEVLLDEATVPLEMHVNSGGGLHLTFLRLGEGIRLLMDRGSDKLDLQIQFLEGGRWRHAQDNL